MIREKLWTWECQRGLSALSPARPLGRRQYPGALKGCGIKRTFLCLPPTLLVKTISTWNCCRPVFHFTVIDYKHGSQIPWIIWIIQISIISIPNNMISQPNTVLSTSVSSRRYRRLLSNDPPATFPIIIKNSHLKWINFNPSMDKKSHAQYELKLLISFPNFNDAIVEVWEWISNFIPHFIIDIITYP